MKQLLALFFSILSIYSWSQLPVVDTAGRRMQGPPIGTITTTLQTPAHDPVMIKEGSRFYLFCTGMGISVFSSFDLKEWRKEKPVFDKAPQWAVDTIPGFRGHIWAPDICFHKGLFYLYYSVSAFGKNTSAIGLATNKTLDVNDVNYLWTDHGRVLQSYSGTTDWNAIDPNIITDKKGKPWMSFGSFWDGLKLVQLTKNRLSIAEGAATIPTIASRKKQPLKNNLPAVDDNPKDAGGNAIEAPFIFFKNGYYYLFASVDYCCKGVKSTYKMIAGRSKKVQGPYLDKDNVSMAYGGGSLVLAGNEKWYGVGHNAVVSFDGIDYLIFHGYDAADNGKSKLRIEKLSWDNESWPIVLL